MDQTSSKIIRLLEITGIFHVQGFDITNSILEISRIGASAQRRLRTEEPTDLDGTNSDSPTTGFHAHSNSPEYIDNPEDEEELEEVDDDDMLSELSEGVDFQDDLLDALEDDDLSFPGSFYHSSLLTTAPNPCLSISGLGGIGLPLHEHEAKRIISCATLAPFGHGERTVVDKDVRDTWEIDPSRLSFTHPQWEMFIQNTVCAQVCESLGVSVGDSLPKMELYKLLLYEKGSHFLPHQDTQKANGMFATVIIILPSAYTGGQVVLSHASTTRTIDFSEDSHHASAVLSWYTDVKHEVKHITSGYRLALSYNLIQVASPDVPIPSLPDTSSSGAYLERVLRKWRDDKYEEESERRLVAYLLDHQYSTANLKEGLMGLKGVDAYRVAFLRPIASKLGFLVGLASLEHNICGMADDEGFGYYNRGRWDDEDDDEYEGRGSRRYIPSMAEVGHATTKIFGVVDLNGALLLPKGKIEVKDYCLVPKEPFEDVVPDKKDYEGYMGNGAGQLDYWYRRTALILMYEDDLDDMRYAAEGISFAFEKLKQSTANSPTAEDHVWANRILEKHQSLRSEQVKTLMRYFLTWKDLELWRKLVKSSTCSLDVVSFDLLRKAWKVFSFKAVRVSFEEILARSKGFNERMSFVYSVQAKATGPEIFTWCRKESDKILSAYRATTTRDIPTILSIINQAGLEAFSRCVKPNLSNVKGAYHFWIALRKSLKDNRDVILEAQAKIRALDPLPSPVIRDGEGTSVSASPATAVASPADPILDDLIRDCLAAAASRWLHAANSPYYRSVSQNQRQNFTGKIAIVLKIVEEALVSGELEICRTLFVDVFKSSGSPYDKAVRFYSPLIRHLRTLFTKLRQDICSPPFTDVMQVFIGAYLHDVLGNRSVMSKPLLEKVGCGCDDCKPLDVFILDPNLTTITFRVNQKRRNHLQSRLQGRAGELCTFQTLHVGTPMGLEVKKGLELMHSLSWSARQKSAKEFLKLIGTEADIAKIMGTRYVEVTRALSGVEPFGPVPVLAAASSGENKVLPPPTAAAAQVRSKVASRVNQEATTSSSNTMPAKPTATPAVAIRAGQKRKTSPIILGSVIDLTGEESS